MQEEGQARETICRARCYAGTEVKSASTLPRMGMQMDVYGDFTGGHEPDALTVKLGE